MNYILLIFFTILPFSQFIFRTHYLLRDLDLWHLQGIFYEFMILCMFGYMVYKPPQIRKGNLTLAIFIFSLLLTALFHFTYSLVQLKIYNLPIIMTSLNLILVIIFYKSIVGYLIEIDLKKILKYLSYSISIILGYCIIQLLNMDIFYKSIGGFTVVNDCLVGTIGNNTHLANFLAITLPVLYFNKTKLSSLSIIVSWIIILLTGSATGLTIALLTTVFYNFFFKIRFKYEAFLVIPIFLMAVIWFKYKGYNTLFNFFNPEGRIECWKYCIQYVKNSPFVGIGFGMLRFLKPIGWQHTHCEPYNLAIEAGIVVAIMSLWIVYSYFKEFFKSNKTELLICLSSMFLAFFLSTLFNFTGHLYLTGSLGIFGYSGLYALKGDKL